MRILIAAATEGEIIKLESLKGGKHTLDFLITGIGMLETSFSLTEKLCLEEFDLVINCGLAGSFSKDLIIGEIVFVEEEILSELGAEDGTKFLSVEEMGLSAEWKLSCEKITSSLPDFRKVKSITVNTVHGNEDSIHAVKARLNPDIENMEGAAVFFVCKKLAVPFVELRAISNYVEKRNRDAWNIPLALTELNKAIQHVINVI